MVEADRSLSQSSTDTEAIEQRLLQSLWTILMMLVDEHMQNGPSTEVDAARLRRPDQRRWLH